MAKLSSRVYHSQIVDIMNTNLKSDPDRYDFTNGKHLGAPENDFVISRKQNGETLSKYGDLKWNINPYRSSCDVKRSLLNFEKFPIKQITVSKYLVFMLMYRFSSSRSRPLTASTIECYHAAIFKLAAFADSRDCILPDTLSDEAKFKDFLRCTDSANCLFLVSGIIGHLQEIGEEIYGFPVPIYDYGKLIKRRLSKLKSADQTPVIPSRILWEMINLATQTLDEIYRYSTKLTTFLDEFFKYRLDRPNLPSKQCSLFIRNSAAEFGLEYLFQKYDITTQSRLSTFIKRIFLICQTYLIIFSGMRVGEVLSLHCRSLKRVESANGVQYSLVGFSTKAEGSEKPVVWVTSADAKLPFNLAKKLSLSLVKWAKNENPVTGICEYEPPLFISTGYLIPGKNRSNNADNLVRLAVMKSGHTCFLDLFDQSVFKIQQCDLEDLNTVDPFRAWSTEDNYKLGATWSFKTLQYRRSLAYYASQSSLISFQSLKRQMKHILRDTTYYYCSSQSHNPVDDQLDHISRLFQEQKPISEAIAYEKNIILSNEVLHGANGSIIEKNRTHRGRINFLETDRKSILESIKKGTLAYSDTPLGGCTSLLPCDKKVALEISACISCPSAVIKTSKLDYAIRKLEAYISQYSDGQQTSFEVRFDEMELQNLKKFKTILMKKLKQP